MTQIQHLPETVVDRLDAVQQYYQLEPRMADLLLAIGRGRSFTEAASELGIKRDTVKNRWKAINRVIGLPSSETRKIAWQVYTGQRYGEDQGTIPAESVCTECKSTLTIEHFPYWPADPICKQCRDDIQTGHSAIRRKEKIKSTLDAVLKETARNNVQLPSVTALLAGVADEFGGVEGLSQEWARHIKIAAEEHAGEKFVLDHLMNFSRLLLQSHVAGGDMANLDSMDDDELRDYLASLVLSQLASGSGSQQTLLKLLVDDKVPDSVLDIGDGKACA